MTWLLLRQHRSFAIATAGALALFAVAVVITGIHMADVYAHAGSCAGGRCVETGRLFQGYGAIVDTVHLTIVVPVVLAGFGATLVARETEAHTNVLAWTQSITRRRWVVAKVGAALAAALVIGVAVSTLVTWWSGTPNSLDGNRFQGAQFETQNVVPVACAVFGVALGLAVGSILRRVLPALVTTVVVYVAVRLAMGVYLRPTLLPLSVRRVPPMADAQLPKGSWSVDTALAGPHGRIYAEGRVPVPRACAVSSVRDVARCMGRLGYHDVVRFHPPSQYWPLQWIEFGILVALALGLATIAIVWTLRRDA
ncbi:MAG: hypothetical protein ACXVLO_06335 [Acidimicrobiia bacterium]